jgi:hypothetical protein
MPNPSGTYYCDIKSDEPEQLHYAAEGMVVCDRYASGNIEDAAVAARVSPDMWVHAHVRKAEDEAWKLGYAQGLSQSHGDLLARLLERLERVDDDEIGLMLAELKAGVGKG